MVTYLYLYHGHKVHKFLLCLRIIMVVDFIQQIFTFVKYFLCLFKVKSTVQACSIVNIIITIYETIFLYHILYICFSFNNEEGKVGL